MLGTALLKVLSPIARDRRPQRLKPEILTRLSARLEAPSPIAQDRLKPFQSNIRPFQINLLPFQINIRTNIRTCQINIVPFQINVRTWLFPRVRGRFRRLLILMMSPAFLLLTGWFMVRRFCCLRWLMRR